MTEIWESTLKRFAFRMPMPMSFASVAHDEYGVRITLQLDVLDSTTREPTRAYFVRHAPPIDPDDERGRVEWVRSVVRDAVLHELDESLFVDGVMFRDPHIAVGDACPVHDGCLIESVSSVDGPMRFTCAKDKQPRSSPRVTRW